MCAAELGCLQLHVEQLQRCTLFNQTFGAVLLLLDVATTTQGTPCCVAQLQHHDNGIVIVILRWTSELEPRSTLQA